MKNWKISSTHIKNCKRPFNPFCVGWRANINYYSQQEEINVKVLADKIVNAGNMNYVTTGLISYRILEKCQKII